ncbi:MAG: TIGR03915 family putative DNA repair protein [Clostridia bacterium]|nr:TIGR03915 family putative DNA repair protein [Clostridia bacterium]
MIIYVTDGSAESFFTAVYYAYSGNSIITGSDYVQLTIDSEVVYVKPESDKVKRVTAKIDGIDGYALGDIDIMLRSCDSLKEQTVLEYLRLIVKENRPVRKMLSHPVVIETTDIINKVTGEAHNMKGFLRFMETQSGAMYAPYAPDNDVTELIVPHFTARLGKTKFAIHDLKRKKAALYDGNDWFMANVGEAEVYLSEYEKTFEGLWKKYYASVTLAERPHEKQMKGYMPVRYWKYMPEKYS